MKNTLKLGTLTFATFLCACQLQTPPEDRASRTQAVLQTTYDHIDEQFSPLVGICLNFANNGVIERDKLKSLGFEEKKLLGKPYFSKSIGPAKRERVSVSYSQKFQSCSLSTYPIIKSEIPLYLFTDKSMTSQGYTKREDAAVRGHQVLYQRGDSEIVASLSVHTGAGGQIYASFAPPRN